MAPRPVFELDAFCPPPYAAAILHWVAANYTKYASKSGRQSSLNPGLGIFALSILAPSETRKAVTQRQGLGTITSDLPEWRHEQAAMFQAWSDTYWAAVAWGTAHDLLGLDGVRLLAGSTTPPLDTEFHKEIRVKCMAMGWSLAQDVDDAACWRAIQQPRMEGKT